MMFTLIFIRLTRVRNSLRLLVDSVGSSTMIPVRRVAVTLTAATDAVVATDGEALTDKVAVTDEIWADERKALIGEAETGRRGTRDPKKIAGKGAGAGV